MEKDMEINLWIHMDLNMDNYLLFNKEDDYYTLLTLLLFFLFFFEYVYILKNINFLEYINL